MTLVSTECLDLTALSRSYSRRYHSLYRALLMVTMSASLLMDKWVTHTHAHTEYRDGNC